MTAQPSDRSGGNRSDSNRSGGNRSGGDRSGGDRSDSDDTPSPEPARTARRARRRRPKRRNKAELRKELLRYVRVRRRLSRSLLGLLAAFAILVVFHNPAAWAHREFVFLLYYAALGSCPLLILLAYLFNGQMAERRGYCLGKYDASPAELLEEQNAKP